MDPANYDYSTAGFNSFLTRSLDDAMSASAFSLESAAGAVANTTQEVNFDQAPTTGALGSNLTIGNITLDGTNGRITVSDGNNTRVVIGNLE